MTTNVTQVQDARVSFAGHSHAANGLALVRVTVGAMLVWVFFENLGKGTYTTAGYAGVINYYIKNSHSPALWKWVMGIMAGHAAMAAPLQAVGEISLGILLVIGLLTRPVAFAGIPVPRQPLGVGTGHVVDLGTTGSGGGIARTGRGTRRASLGHRRVAGTAASDVSVVVMSESACEFRSSFQPITKRRPLAVCLPICLPISSLRSSLWTAIRLTGRPISPERWGHESSRSLGEDTGALV